MEIVEYFVKKGADINAKDNKGKTPLDLAESPEVVTFLKRQKPQNIFRRVFGIQSYEKQKKRL